MTIDRETLAALCGRLRRDPPDLGHIADTIELIYADRLSFSRILTEARTRLNCPEGHDLIAWIVHLKVHDDALSKEYERLSREREAICAALGIAPTDDPVEAITADVEEKAHWIAEHERALADLERERHAHASTSAECRRLEERAVEAELEVQRVKDLIERDRTGLGAGLHTVRQVLIGFRWIADGAWGCYSDEEQTEETLRKEVSDAFDRIEKVASDALGASGLRVHEAFHPGDDQARWGSALDEVNALRARAEKAEAEVDSYASRLDRLAARYGIDVTEPRHRNDALDQVLCDVQSLDALRAHAAETATLRPLAAWVDQAAGRGEGEGYVEACERLLSRWRSEAARSGAEVMHLRDSIEETHAILDPIVPRVRQGEPLEYQARRAAGVVRALLAALMRAEEAAASARTVSAE